MIINTLTKSLLVALILSAGCMMGEDHDALNGNATGADQAAWADLDDCKIEGSDIGVEGLTLGLGRASVSFHDWVSKDGEAGEYVGFSLSISGADRLGYIVKTGGDRYHSEDTTWIHPNGSAGSDAPAISNVDFCENDPNDPTDPNDPGCTDPDGCDNNPGDPTDPTDPGCTDPDGCDNNPGDGGACVDDPDCGANEFCNDYGVCVPVVL